MNYIIRPISPHDNIALASIIRMNIEQLGLPTEGTAHSDPTTDHLYELFDTHKSAYWVVASAAGNVVGGCGVFPTKALPNNCCELVRFFLLPNWHGQGIGKILMQQCIDTAKKLGYTSMYLESFPDMKAAISLYERFGFKYLSSPLGESGHFACNVWMLKQL